MADERRSELLNKLLEQNLTVEELMRRLDAIVERECSRPDGQQDQELLDACLDLQWYMATGEHYVSNKAEAKAKLDERIRKASQRERRRKLAFRRAALAACCAAVLLFMPVIGERMRGEGVIRGTTVDNGEIYQLNGEAVTPMLLDSAIVNAEADEEDFSITTTNYQLISKIPGVPELHLGYVPEGWTGSLYQYDRRENVVYYAERYCRKDSVKALDYECTVFPSFEAVTDGIEQNEQGDPISIGNHKVYLAQNIDVNLATWSGGLTSYTIYGLFTEQELIQMIEAVGGRQDEKIEDLRSGADDHGVD